MAGAHLASRALPPAMSHWMHIRNRCALQLYPPQTTVRIGEKEWCKKAACYLHTLRNEHHYWVATTIFHFSFYCTKEKHLLDTKGHGESMNYIWIHSRFHACSIVSNRRTYKMYVEQLYFHKRARNQNWPKLTKINQKGTKGTRRHQKISKGTKMDLKGPKLT